MLVSSHVACRRDLFPTEEIAMASAVRVDISTGPRAVVSTAADLIYKFSLSVLGPERVPTAKSNAWAAVCADRERARLRDSAR
jgi:hypothetical protein